VVLAVERRLNSPLMEPNSVEKIFEVDTHIGCAVSGILGDARTLVDHARAEAQNHRFTYSEAMKVESVTNSVCDLALHFGEGDGSERKPMARPYGVALLIAGVDKQGPSLFTTDPSGTMFKYRAKAIGSAAEVAQTTLEELWHSSLSLQDGVRMALNILKQVMEEKITNLNVEVSVVGEERSFRRLTPEEIQSYLDAL
jgi:20S proteasome subunit alpha 5